MTARYPDRWEEPFAAREYEVLVAGDRIEETVPNADLGLRVVQAAKVVNLKRRFHYPASLNQLATPPDWRQGDVVHRRDIEARSFR